MKTIFCILSLFSVCLASMNCGQSQHFCDASAGADCIASQNPSNSKKIFVTYETFKGDLGGVLGADEKCAKSETNPGDGTYLALLSDGKKRIACTTSNCSTGSVENHNWVLKPNTTYTTAEKSFFFGWTSHIFRTDRKGIFEFGEMGSVFSSEGEYATVSTGLYGDWTAAENCKEWSTENTSEKGAFGELRFYSSYAIYSGAQSCSNFRQIICVEQ